MKKSLLATVAAAALFSGGGLAVAQGAKEQPAAKGAGGAEMQRGADSKGGAEIKGGADVKRSQTNGAGGADIKADNKAGADMKKPNGQMQSESKADSRTSTTGQGASEQKAQGKTGPAASEQKAQGKDAPAASRNQAQQGAQQRGDAHQGSRQSQTTGQGAAGGTQAGGAVTLTSEQKTKIRTTVLQSSGAPKIERSKVNFNISVGTVVPRTIHLVAVPPTLVEIHPAWRGYRYFIVDDEIIIVEPSSFKIVAVVYV